MSQAGIDAAGAERVRSQLGALGFDVVRFARVEPLFGPALRDWLAAGHHADMGWLERGADKRGDPDLVLPGARTMVMLGVNYRGAADAGGVDDARPVWARYALNDDYHDTIRAGLAAAGRVLEELGGIGPADHRYYVDTGPVLERGWAARAGVGSGGRAQTLPSLPPKPKRAGAAGAAGGEGLSRAADGGAAGGGRR
jgi:epoxyqueuosine reductase